MSSKTNHDKVGYKHPPKHTRFKPGQSGNPRGRPKRARSLKAEFLEELKFFPQNIRARAGLAMVYQATEQPDAAARVVEEMTRITPTQEGYALAARLYQMFGDRQSAEAMRAEARRGSLAAGRSR